MFFKREQKNRRLNRRHVLDVKVRSEQVRSTRMRLITGGCLLVFGTVFGLYLFWRAGAWTLDKFVYENPNFAIEQIDIHTDGKISDEQLRRWSGVRFGQNLIALNLAAVKRNLQMVSAINSVSVERVLPRMLRIRVTERDPIAQVNVPCADARNGISLAVFQLDAAGVVMQPLDPCYSVIPLGQVSVPLPVLTGLNIFQLQSGHRVILPQVQAALTLINDFGHSPMAGVVELQRIDVSSSHVIVVTTAQGSEITFGLDNVPLQLARWREIYNLGLRMSKTIATADLAVANNVPVHWSDMVSAPYPTPGTFNIHNSWRKNV